MTAETFLAVGLTLGAAGVLMLGFLLVAGLCRAASREPGVASFTLTDPDPFEWEGVFPSAPDVAGTEPVLFPCVLVSPSGVEIPIADEGEMVEAVRYLGLVDRLAAGTEAA